MAAQEIPAQLSGFLGDLDQAVRVIELIGARKVNALAGRRRPGMDEATQLDCLVDNLARAADRFQPLGVQVVTEMLNPRDVPGFLIASVDIARHVLSRLEGRVLLQLDVYHLQRAQGELLRTIAELAPSTGHIQIADAPDRTEPGTGEINFRNVLAGIAATGYAGFIGLEYRPTPGCVDAFAWVEEYGLVRA